MISDKTKQDVINKLTNMTINDQITWSYLDENKELCKKNNLYPAYTDHQIVSSLKNKIHPDKLIFDARDSYVCKVQDFYFLLAKAAPLYESEGVTILMIVPSTLVNSESLYYQGAEVKLNKLIYLVSIKFSNGEECIEKFLKM